MHYTGTQLFTDEDRIFQRFNSSTEPSTEDRTIPFFNIVLTCRIKKRFMR
jgi:hypothetical protein